MAATRLSDSQKTELVVRFRGGESTQTLADAYGCSANTISRVVKAVLDPADYERLKQSRGRRVSRSSDVGSEADAAGASEIDPPAEPAAAVVVAPQAESNAGDSQASSADSTSDDDDGPAVLAIDDADDFGDDEDDDFSEEESDDAAVFIPIAVSVSIDDHLPVTVLPFRSADLPTSAYMLVDKTVELQPRPLSEFPELAGLAAEELQRQALTIYPNPRQAKRQCGRTQRVIKLPDLSLLERTAPYLLAQGISRVVIESTPYALPDS